MKYICHVQTIAYQWLELVVVASSEYTARHWLRRHVFKPGAIRRITIVRVDP